MPPFLPLGNTGNSDVLQIIDPVLSNVARQFRPHGFIYDDIVAPQYVEMNIGQYPVFNLADFFTADGNQAVADNAATPEVEFEWSTEPYHCKDFRRKVRLTRKDYQQANPNLRIETLKTLGLLSIMAVNREGRLAAKLRAAGNGGQFTQASGVEPTVKWDKGTTSVPATIQTDVQLGITTAYKTCGMRPNAIVMSRTVALAIANDPTVKTQIQYVHGLEAIARGDMILPPTLFGLKTIVADGAMENTAAQGKSAELSEIWGNSVRLIYVDPAAVWGTPCTAYSFRGKVGEGYESPNPGQISQDEPMGGYSWAVVERWAEPDPPATCIRAWECVDEHLVAPELGYELEKVLENP